PSGSIGASASRRQPPTPQRSGRIPPADTQRPAAPTTTAAHATPSPQDPVTLTVEQPADPRAETEPFAEAIDSKTEFAPPALVPASVDGPSTAQSPAASSPPPQPPFDWTPILLGLVIVLSMTVLYLLIK